MFTKKKKKVGVADGNMVEKEDSCKSREKDTERLFPVIHLVRKEGKGRTQRIDQKGIQGTQSDRHS